MNDRQAQDTVRDAFLHMRKVDRNVVPPFSRMKTVNANSESSSWHFPATALAAIAVVAIGVTAWLMPIKDSATPMYSNTYDELLDPLAAMPTDFLLEVPGDRLASATPEFLTTLPDYLTPEDPQDVN